MTAPFEKGRKLLSLIAHWSARLDLESFFTLTPRPEVSRVMAMPGFKGTLNLSGKAFVDEEAQVRAWFSRD